jgi:hypothetical protein
LVIGNLPAVTFCVEELNDMVRRLQTAPTKTVAHDFLDLKARHLAIYLLDYHLKTGHTLSVQNRPTGLAED